MKNSMILSIVAMFLVGGLFSSCSKEDSGAPVEISDVMLAKEILENNIILSTRAKMGVVDKTLLERGCPTKFAFNWEATETWTPSVPGEVVLIKLDGFTVGAMPLVIDFLIEVKFLQLNSWEKDEYTGEGWLKLKGENGITVSAGDDDTNVEEGDGSGATLIGYLNVKTKEVEFQINYNMMNVTTNTFLQTIDNTRIDRYEEEFAQFEKDLEEYKEANGL